MTPEFIEKCQAAMSKPAPLAALRLIASGCVVVFVKGTDIYLDTLDGKPVRHAGEDVIAEKGELMGIAGAWPLIGAGLVDQFGCVTPAGREFLVKAGAQ